MGGVVGVGGNTCEEIVDIVEGVGVGGRTLTHSGFDTASSS